LQVNAETRGMAVATATSRTDDFVDIMVLEDV
jgi:hypothetical protein